MLLELEFEAATAAVGIKSLKLKGYAHGASSVSDRITALWLQNQLRPSPQPHPTNKLYLCSDKVSAHLCRDCVL